MNTRDLVIQAIRERVQGYVAGGADVDINVLSHPDPDVILVQAVTEPFGDAPRYRIRIEPED